MIRRAKFYLYSSYFAENNGKCKWNGIKVTKKVETNIGMVMVSIDPACRQK
jgi:hypothetical protein